jgi:hypothetical protein
LPGELGKPGLTTFKIVPTEAIPILWERPPAGVRGVPHGGDHESAHTDRVSNVCHLEWKSDYGSNQKKRGNPEEVPSIKPLVELRGFEPLAS